MKQILLSPFLSLPFGSRSKSPALMPVSVVPGRSAPLGFDNAMRTIIPNLAKARKRDSAECERRRQRCSSHVRPSSDDHTLYATTLPRDRENEPSQWLGAGVACLLWLPSLAADDAFFFQPTAAPRKIAIAFRSRARRVRVRRMKAMNNDEYQSRDATRLPSHSPAC